MSSLPELKLSEVLHVLKPIEVKYFEVGVQLDVSVETLQVIKEENLTFSLRLCKTIHSWHNNSSSERCTWSTLADAVARVGGHDNLVRELRKRGNNAPVSQQPSEDNSEDTGYSTKSDSAISDTESSSGSETERFELMPGCGCGKEKPCSLYTLCARGCPNPTRRRIPVLQKKRVGADNQDDLPFEDEDDCEDYERETKKIQKCSGDFVTDVCCSFKKQKVDIETLTLYLQSSFPVMKPRLKELNEATSMEQVFKIVVDQACSWFDYEVIVSIIQKFGDSSDKHRAQMYEEEFKKYAEQRLPKGKKHIEIGSGAKVGTKQLVIKIDKEWEKVTFTELDKLRGSFADILGVRRSDLYLADVREGCIMMTFMIQEELGNKLFPTKSCLTTEQIHSLKSESVISVRCGKLSWRSSAMASNKIKFNAMPGPIEPWTMGDPTTANDISDAVTDMDPIPNMRKTRVLLRTFNFGSNRMYAIEPWTIRNPTTANDVVTDIDRTRVWFRPRRSKKMFAEELSHLGKVIWITRDSYMASNKIDESDVEMDRETDTPAFLLMIMRFDKKKPVKEKGQINGKVLRYLNGDNVEECCQTNDNATSQNRANPLLLKIISCLNLHFPVIVKTIELEDEAICSIPCVTSRPCYVMSESTFSDALRLTDQIKQVPVELHLVLQRMENLSVTELGTIVPLRVAVVPDELFLLPHSLSYPSRLEGSPGEGERYHRQDTQTSSEAEL